MQTVLNPDGTIKGDGTPASSSYNLPIGFQGMLFDPVLSDNLTPNRVYDPMLGTWTQADPAGYVDGSSLYQTDDSNPVGNVDPAGKASHTPSEWQALALQRANIDPSAWKPDDGLTLNQANNVVKVYKYYETIFGLNSKFHWAGLAKLAGGAVTTGLEKLHNATCIIDGEFSIVREVLLKFEKMFLKIQKSIFQDLAWQHEAYLSGGIAEIQRLHDANALTDAGLDAWKNIDSGTAAGISKGNEALLRREQGDVIQPYYDKVQWIEHWVVSEDYVGEVTALMTPNFLPGAKCFEESQLSRAPKGSPPTIFSFNQRWAWLTTDVLPVWEAMTDAQRQKLVSDPLGSTVK